MSSTHTEAAAAAAQEVRDTGSVVLRDAWPLEPLRVLRAEIASFQQWRLKQLAEGNVGPGERLYITHGVGTATALLARPNIDEDFLRNLFRASSFRDLCVAYFDSDRLYIKPKGLGFRIHDPAKSRKSFIPYHQDSYSQDKRTPHILNCWIPLDEGAGTTAPGLEVVRNPCHLNFPRKAFGLLSENAAYDSITIDRARIVEEYGDNFMAPAFDLGDGLAFSENVIHRTYVTPEMTQPRINFEFRVFSADRLAPGVNLSDINDPMIRVC